MSDVKEETRLKFVDIDCNMFEVEITPAKTSDITSQLRGSLPKYPHQAMVDNITARMIKDCIAKEFSSEVALVTHTQYTIMVSGADLVRTVVISRYPDGVVWR